MLSCGLAQAKAVFAQAHGAKFHDPVGLVQRAPRVMDLQLLLVLLEELETARAGRLELMLRAAGAVPVRQPEVSSAASKAPTGQRT